MRKATICALVVVLFLWIVAVPAIYAQPPNLIDQHNDEESGCACALTNSLIFYHPMGQEFIPTRNRLLAVDVLVRDFGGGATDLNLYIRTDTIDGDIVASETFSVTTGFGGWKHIHITPVVSLNPGSKYVIQVELTDMTKNWGWTSDGRCYVDTYPDGTWIMNGVPQDETCTNDLGFRTYAPPGH